VTRAVTRTPPRPTPRTPTRPSGASRARASTEPQQRRRVTGPAGVYGVPGGASPGAGTAGSARSAGMPRKPRVPGSGGVRRGQLRLGSPGRRLRGGAVLLALLLLVLGGRLVQLQGFQSQHYAGMATAQRTRVLPQAAWRGQITDRNGAVLAVDVDARDIYAQPRDIADVDVAATELAPLLAKPQEQVRTKLLSASSFVYLERGVDPQVAKKITALDLKGVGSLPERTRLYPTGSLAANVIGFAGRDGAGLAGIESAYNTALAGRDGRLVIEEDPQGRVIPAATHHEVDSKPGRGVQLTLDRDLQYVAQKALASGVQQAQADKGVAIVMDPRTGDVLAMASAPTFDPNNPSRAKADQFGNPATAWTYEPGSVNKVITIAAGIEHGIITATTVINVPGSPTPGIKAGSYTISDAESHPPEPLTVAGVLAQSSNLGTLLISRMLGAPVELETALRGFGLGAATGVGFPGESSGILQPSAEWDVSRAANIPFGQGMSVTPLQMASVYATIANGGLRMPPRLVEGLVGTDGLAPAPQGAPRRVVSPATAATVSELLEAVTTADGTAPKAAIPGYRVAGKTGTASRIGPDGRYSGYVASFVGFAPADKPAYVVAVVVDNPRNGHYGGAVSAPIFQQIMSYALAAGRVPPTLTPPAHFPLKGQ